MSVKQNSRKKIQPDWWMKSIAGCVLGFLLALALSGLFAWLGPGGIDAPAKTQFIMWMISPLWMLVLSLTFLFQTGLRAIVWLSGINVLAYMLLFMIRNVFV